MVNFCLILAIILIRTGGGSLTAKGVHLQPRGFTYSQIAVSDTASHLTQPTHPNYTSSEGFTYRIIVIDPMVPVSSEQSPSLQRYSVYVFKCNTRGTVSVV